MFTRAVRVGAVVALLGALSFQSASAERVPGKRRGGLNLRALVYVGLEVNRVFCGINVLGEVCVDPTNSPILPGGFWPKGTPNQYIFNSGLQLGGIIPSDAGFAWAGDTTGAYFMDARGDQGVGDPVSLIFNSLDPDDAAGWPVGAQVRDTAIYNPILIGRDNMAQQDLWVRIWDGNPTIAGGREHPMGILIEERALGWAFPSGNEDIVYIVYTFYNISATDRSVYDGLYPAIQDSVHAIAVDYVQGSEQRFGVDIPSAGYTITEMFAAFYMDPDVGDAGANYSTAILPFQMAIAYKSDFLETGWSFPAEINGPPFHPSPGFVGVKYLKSPVDPITGLELGLTMFSNTVNAAGGFPDPVGVVQMWRYISGNVSPAAGDNNCTFPNPKERGLCFLWDQQADTRFYQSSGPFELAPGEAASIVVAYVHAAPVAKPLEDLGVDGVGGDVKPLTPYPGDSIFAGSCQANPGNVCIRSIDSIAGWLTHSDVDGDFIIEQDEVVSVPRSLLSKAIVAQSVFDNQFLLPFAPEPVVFFPIAEDNQVTVVWQKSNTEFIGDPFFSVASVPGPLFDANFRQFDVEGYRIYRGRTTGQLRLIIQYDYAGTVFTDFNGGLDYTGNCAPELGITIDCPAFPNDAAIISDFVQVPPGGRVLLADDATILNVVADTAMLGGDTPFPPMDDGGVPFAFVDLGVRNGFTYHYAVTAFDVNSVASAPGSLESARVTKSIIPRTSASNFEATVTVQGVAGDDGELLDPLTPWPDINSADGTFDGPIPPVNTGLLELTAALVEALPLGDIFVRTDSVDRGWAGGFGDPPNLYVTMGAGGTIIQKTVAITEPSFNSAVPQSSFFSEALVPYDSNAIDVLGIEFDQDVRMPIQFTWTTTGMAHSSQAVSTASGRYGVAGFGGSRYLGHSRWYDEGGTQAADPNITAEASAANNAGQLTGINWMWAPSGYRSDLSDVAATLRGQGASGYTAWYNADFVVTWSGGGVTVRDSTHHVTLPFNNSGGTGYGFLTLAGVLATGMDATIWASDVDDGVGSSVFDIIAYQHLYMTNPTCTNTWWAIPAYCVTLSQTAEIQPLDVNQPDGVSDGNGFILMINSEYFWFGTDAVPADGTVWHLQAVSGVFNADCTPALQAVMTDCDNYTFSPNTTRPSIVPGLTYQISVTAQAGLDSIQTGDLENVHTVPDPYYVTTSLEAISDQKLLQFVNLPNQAIIRIYSVSGILVTLLEHNDPTGGGSIFWDMRNRNSQIVASGVYFYHVETPTGLEKIGRFTIVNFAQ